MADGNLTTEVARIYDLEEASEFHQARRTAIGKLIIRP
jgi:NADPH:quinone reductase-like Zn-dependent oxidoreductase